MSDLVSSGSLTPPYDPNLLADLHAGVLPAAVADELWPRAVDDADAAAVLAALDATAAELRTLRAPVEPMPEFIAAQLRRALLAESSESSAAPAVPPRPASRRRGGPSRFTMVAAATAAAVVVGVGAFVGLGRFGTAPTDPGATAAPSAMAGTIDMPDGTVSPRVALAVRGSAIVGRLGDAKLRSDCLSANGYGASTALLGAAPAKVGERLGTLLLIPGDRPPIVIALVVGDRCSAGNPDLLAVNTVTD